MNYLSLQIDGQWAYLKEGTEITLEGNNPIFSDAGSKTYLFQLHVESNRHLFGNADDIYGESYYKTIDGKRATLYVAGIPVMTGKVSLEDEVYVDEDGCVAINLVSGNLEFAQMIEGMNCRDVELKDDIEIGYIYDSASVLYELNPLLENDPGTNSRQILNNDLTFYFPENYVAVTNTNILSSYREGGKFCNIRRTFLTKNTAIATNYIESHESEESPRIKLFKGDTGDSVISLEYNSMRSAPCFYVLYFLDCLFYKLGLSVNNNSLISIEDACRLAFVNTDCKVKRKGEVQSVTIDEENKPYPGFGREFGNYEWSYYNLFVVNRMRLKRQRVFATSENFPDIEVSSLIDAVQNIFNVRILCTDGELNILSVPDILKSSQVNTIHAEVFDAGKIENNIKGFRLCYDSDDEEDTNFKFDYNEVKRVKQYGEILPKISVNNPTVYIDERNGNTYAIKVSKEAVENGDEEELNPSLFEVGGFLPVTYGDCSEKGKIEEVRLSFTPIINNDIDGIDNINKAKNPEAPADIDSTLENRYALLVDVGDDPKWTSIKETVVFKYRQNNRMDWFQKEAICSVAFYDYNPKEDSGSEFMLGIMRGPGNAAGIEYYDENFDGEGNSRVAFTSANYAFTSDSIDNCDRDFDYNGTGSGGVDYDGRFSLKLRAGKFDKDGNPITDADGKPIPHDADRANRGLYDKFWKEYAYFTVNKKIVRLRLRMEIADLVSLDWTKRYRIGDYLGFVASWNVTVSDNGFGVIDMDMYYL